MKGSVNMMRVIIGMLVLITLSIYDEYKVKREKEYEETDWNAYYAHY